MSSFLYLTTRKAKNKLNELFHKPLKLVVALCFTALLVMNFTLSENAPLGERPMTEFRAIIFIFHIASFVTEVKKGLQRGGTMFSMADVNLMLTAPVKPLSVLFHGTLGRFGSSLFMGIAFVYQFALLRAYYPVRPADMIISVIGYGTVAFVSQIAGMLVYSCSCGEAAKIRKVKLVLYSIYILFAVLFLVRFISNDNPTVSSAARCLTALPMRFFPVAGWVLTFVDGFMLYDGIKIAFGIIPCLVFVLVAFLLIAFSKRGFYEDVLLSVERGSDEKARDGIILAEGRTDIATIKKGRGASAIFYKHLAENRRTKTYFFAPSSLFNLALIAVYGFLFRSGYLSLFALSCSVSVITVLSGRWIREITMPYIYLIPESPYKKLFFMMPELLPKFIIESILHCLLIGFISRLSPATVGAMLASRLAFCFLLTSSALLVARLFREREKNNIFAAVCVFASFIFALPSVALCLKLAGFGMGMIIGFIAMALINTAISFLLLLSARRLLEFTK